MTRKIQTRGLGSGVRHRFESVSTTWCLLSHNTSVYQLLFPSFHILPLPLSSQFQTSCLRHQTNLPLHRFTPLPSKGFQCLRESSTSDWNTEACNRPSRPPTTLGKGEEEKLDKQTKTYFLKATGNHRFKKSLKALNWRGSQGAPPRDQRWHFVSEVLAELRKGCVGECAVDRRELTDDPCED